MTADSTARTPYEDGPLSGEGEAAALAAQPASEDVERLGHAMEDACDRLGVTSLCPADASVLLAAYAKGEQE